MSGRAARHDHNVQVLQLLHLHLWQLRNQAREVVVREVERLQVRQARQAAWNASGEFVL